MPASAGPADRAADPAGVPDAELLARFRSRGDEAAFELLVWRHGPMVLGVCRGVLGDPHAADDAFQATFLALARKADSIGRGEAVPGWLYRVAYRTALHLRERRARQSARERPGQFPRLADPAPPPDEAAALRELRPLLQQEVERLPDKYRAVVVLCCLEGRTNEEAAGQLGCPKGTVLSRLARARERLRRRLSARGMALAAAPFADLLNEHGRAPAVVSPVLVHGTVHLVGLMKVGMVAAGETAEEAGSAVDLMEEVLEQGASAAPTSLVGAVAVALAVAALLLAAGAGLAHYGWPGGGGGPAAGGGAAAAACDDGVDIAPRTCKVR
jgi:RNA polymerase sigma factor (sigma-70 family)